MKGRLCRAMLGLPILALAASVGLLVYWANVGRDNGAVMRLPGADHPMGGNGGEPLNSPSNGRLVAGSGKPGSGNAAWNQFRGPERTGISLEATRLAQVWDSSSPKELWAVDCGEGYAGVAVQDGRVYLMDYDTEKKEGALRCLSTADGAEIWRYAYPCALKRNHGMTRTVPAIARGYVVAMDSKCNVLCVDAMTGASRWSVNLAHVYGATVPPWYAGQCPLIDGTNVILAPGGPDALLVALDLATGALAWKTSNPDGWKMTHSSVMPMEFAGQRFYVYCGSGGVAGVSAADGSLLWESFDWKISIATIASPLVLSGGRIFLSGGYNAGSLMLQLEETNGRVAAVVLRRITPEVFGATQHTPIGLGGYIYGVRPSGQFTCLTENGEVSWTSPPGASFGLGSFIFGDGIFYVMNDSGKLTMLEATSARFHRLGESQILHGRESWAPMALADGHLFVRDSTRLACLDVAAH